MSENEQKVHIFTAPQEFPCGKDSTCCGPVGQSGINAFSGLFMDLEPYLDAMDYDFSDFNASSVDAYRLEGRGCWAFRLPSIPR